MTDPFAILGLPRRFDIDPDQLHKQFITLAARYHPDHAADPIDQLEAAEASAKINEAHRIVNDPESRAHALLELIAGEAMETKNTVVDPSILSDMLEKREQLDEAAAAGDTRQLDELRRWLDQKQQSILANLGRLFREIEQNPDAADNPAEITEDVVKNIRVELDTLRYVRRMYESR